ncbi:dynein light chain cytoplasmic-like [Tripterygium wilfordii]|uniref:Dynein light chain n=1 Tax=Tripterygium wilfordii TaxID=458696 RepID=A0A7J7C985_TRIWF|nr:dynein light chain, cytoplasmic-like [Tripterygium wilfordii]KAF5730670.1 dynein light chain cytoplasmic-like [Tripterygium wilfordii]
MEDSQRRRSEAETKELKKNATHEALNLAGLSIGFNVRLRSSDMPVHMQERALRCTRSFLDSNPRKRPNPTQLSQTLKKEFDSVYGPAWHCVAGTSFGSFVTHSRGGFLYFSVDSLFVLLFKTEVQVVKEV